VSLLPHQQRVVDEKNELGERAKKLSDFIGNNPLFEKIDPEEQERMKVQNDIMWQYFEILEQRIAAFSKGGEA
jgi:septum formation inhibitor MinC